MLTATLLSWLIDQLEAPIGSLLSVIPKESTLFTSQATWVPLFYIVLHIIAFVIITHRHKKLESKPTQITSYLFVLIGFVLASLITAGFSVGVGSPDSFHDFQLITWNLLWPKLIALAIIFPTVVGNGRNRRDIN